MIIKLFKYAQQKTEEQQKAKRGWQQQHLAIREMSLLGGKWIGARQKCDEWDGEPIRLEIFHTTPSELLVRAEIMLAKDYSFLGKVLTQNKCPTLLRSIITYTLRNSDNDILGIAILKLPNNKEEGAFILMVVIDKLIRGVNNGTLLLKTLENYATIIGIKEIAINTLSCMKNELFFKNGYKQIFEQKTPLGTKLVLYKQFSEHKPLPCSKPKSKLKA